MGQDSQFILDAIWKFCQILRVGKTFNQQFYSLPLPRPFALACLNLRCILPSLLSPLPSYTCQTGTVLSLLLTAIFGLSTDAMHVAVCDNLLNTIVLWIWSFILLPKVQRTHTVPMIAEDNIELHHHTYHQLQQFVTAILRSKCSSCCFITFVTILSPTAAYPLQPCHSCSFRIGVVLTLEMWIWWSHEQVIRILEFPST